MARFDSAKWEYERQTGISLSTHPLAVQLERCDSLESLDNVLQGVVQDFTASRGNDGIVMKSLKRVLSGLHVLSANNSTGSVFPPAKVIFTGVAVLINALKDATSSETLLELLKTIERLLQRLDIYIKISPTAAMNNVIIEILVELLSILALLTKRVKQNRSLSGKVAKKLLGENEIEAVMWRLDRLTQNEARMTTAQTLEVVHGLVDYMQVVMEDGKASAHRDQDVLGEKLRQDIRSWLSPADPWKYHNVIHQSRYTGTGSWFVQGCSFSDWKWSSSLLWIHGKPGSGKSTLCSTIIQDIDDLRRGELASLAFFYCSSGEDQKDMRGLLSSVLFQLCDQSDSYFNILSVLYSKHRYGRQDPSDDALTHCLMDILKYPVQVPTFLIIDGLDEYSNTSAIPAPRRKVLMLLEELINLQLPNLHICVTSRPEIDIYVVLNPLTFCSISLHDEDGQTEDIISYIRSIVDTDPDMQVWKAEDKEWVIDTLTKNADGTFRWVYCQLVYLRGCPPRRIRRALSELPEMLDEMYERTLQKIKMAKWESAHLLFQCVAVASRPLYVEELAEFLAFDFETGPFPKFHESWRLDNPLHAVLSICSTLLAAIKVERSRVIQFTHFSAREFLTSTRLAQKPDIISRRFHVSMTLAHTLVAQACLGILLHLDENTTSDSLQKYPLASYAAEHWVFHAEFENVLRNVEDVIKLLFHPKKPHFAIWIWLYDPEVLGNRTERPKRPLQPRGTPLHYAALCGLDTIVNFLLVEHRQDVDALGFDDNSTPLHLASSRGHVDVVRILLEHGANVTHQDELGLTPLHRASQYGHLKVIRLLIEHGTDVNARDHSYWTPLHEASQDGHLDMVHILLEHGANTHALDYGGWTPLLLSSHNGHLAVVLVLLEHGVGVNTGDNSNWTPLHSASQQGHLRVAQVLLEQGADANFRDDSNQTPLHLASRAGYLGFVRLLVERGAAASIHVRNNKNRTPFQEASAKGHHDVVQLLLEYGAQEDGGV